MIAVQLTSRQLLGINQQAYQALRSALSLNLRRQLLIAVCDSVILQERLATQLEEDIISNGKASFGRLEPHNSGTNSARTETNAFLARLIFEPEEAHLPRQVVRRIKQIEASEGRLSQLQVLGVEQMTRQPAMVQNHFLRSLNEIGALLPRLNTSLLVWVSWPWLRTIQESAPEFWQWRNGVYEFVSDLTPTPTSSTYLLNAKTVADERAETLQTNDSQTVNSQTVNSQAINSQKSNQSSSDLTSTNRHQDSEQLTVRLHGETDDWNEFEADDAIRFATGAVTGLPADVATSSPQALPSQADSAPLADESNSPSWQQKADEHFSVGYQRRRLIESGDHTLATIESAITAYEAGLHCLELQGTAADGVMAEGPTASGITQHDVGNGHLSLGSCLNDLGTLYWLKAQQLSDPQQITEGMIHSIQLYSQALEQDAAMACQIYSNIGAVYSLLATYEDPVFCFQQAATVYNQAIMLSPQTDTPGEHATLCNSLGSVYWKLSHHNQTDQHLRLAIGAYKEALRSYDLEDHALDYAAVQNNLGIACWSLAKHESSIAMYEQATAAYQTAIVYRTPENDPAACAVTYNNLALTYWDLSKEGAVERAQKRIYQRDAITAFTVALDTAEGRDILSDTDTAAIYHCLGDVYMQTLDETTAAAEIAITLNKALHSYIQSIECLTEKSPLFQLRLDAILANLRFHYEHVGLSGQQDALNQLPPRLIPYVMPAL